FAFGGSGRGFDTRGDMTLSFNGLSGTLRGVAASGSGTVTHAGTTWGFSGVRIGLGTTSLALDGHVGERLDVNFSVATRDLSLLAPESRGQLNAAGTVSGTLDDPAIIANAHGRDFEYQGVKLASLDADVNFNPGAAGSESKVDVRLHKLSYHGRTFDAVVLSLSGLPADYQVGLAANAAGLAASAQARGTWEHGVFRGQLAKLSVAGSEQLDLALERAVDLTVSPEHVRLEWMCVAGTPGSMCADGEWTPATWSATVMTNELPLATLTAGMTPAVEYLGTVSAFAQFAGGATAPLQGTLRAQLEDAAINHKLASHKVEHTRIGSGTITASATPAQLAAQIELGDGEVGTLSGKVAAQRTSADWGAMPLSGELHAQTSELGLVTLYVPDIDRASGHLNADVRLSGTLGTPTFAGALKLSDGEADVFQVNLALRRVALEARFGDSGIDFSGAVHAGTGEASATGHIEWRGLLPYGKFHLQGTNLRVADVPEAQIDASPDLDFTVNGRRIEVAGKVNVPYAKIQPKDITNAVRASPDEQIVGAEAEDPSKRFEVVSTVTLALGDKVNLDAMGLAARLAGNVTVSSGYDAITRGSGELSVAEGTYTAYARKLDIERGRLIFSGGAIDDPGIDVRATKEFPDVKAGINVRGTLLQPHISFFSDPPLPQAQIVSLILAGGSFQSAQNQSSAALGQGAALLAAQLGSRVGIPDVSVETDPIANETSLVLGRYLSPRLYVSYGVSLTEQ
ncbi:MAG: translocation/assembly module TamB domain-containing protein, partial [Gammaproteobacteria bacterium]|nr:translocation/assembly module TamB domain-containing protein [Gammaproteobacteria bacterium]